MAGEAGCGEESTAAFVLGFRLFLQPRDGIMLGQIEELYRQMPLPSEYKYWVTENLKELNLIPRWYRQSRAYH